MKNRAEENWLCPMYGFAEEFNELLFLACLGSKFVWHTSPCPVIIEHFANRPCME